MTLFYLMPFSFVFFLICNIWCVKQDLNFLNEDVPICFFFFFFFFYFCYKYVMRQAVLHPPPPFWTGHTAQWMSSLVNSLQNNTAALCLRGTVYWATLEGKKILRQQAILPSVFFYGRKKLIRWGMDLHPCAEKSLSSFGTYNMALATSSSVASSASRPRAA